jgi:hypothetical protein
MAKSTEPVAEKAAPEIQPVENWLKKARLPRWKQAAVWAKYRWPEGREMTEAEFLAAVKATLEEVIK